MKASHPSRRLSLSIGLVLIASALGGCAGEGNLVRDVAMATGVTGSEPRPPPDFVARSRSASVDYLPIGTPPPPRATRAKSAAAVSEAEAEMQNLRRRNEARGAQARRDATR